VTSVITGVRTYAQLEATLKHVDLELDHAVLDRLDAIVPPGTDVYDPQSPMPLPWLADPTLRRRAAGRSALAPALASR
jgi:hypothetical protein